MAGALVRMEGVEPTCLAALDPKSSASASFATSATGRKNRYFDFNNSIKKTKVSYKVFFQFFKTLMNKLIQEHRANQMAS